MAGTQWHERAAALEIDGRAFINGQRVWAVSEQTFDDHSPIDGRLLTKVARGDVGRHRRRGGRRARRVRGPALGRQVAGGAQAHADQVRRPGAQECGRAGAARNARHGQADQVQPERRRAVVRQLHPLVRRSDRQDLRRNRADQRQQPGADHARTGRRGRRHRAVELPADHDRVEDRAGARGRQQRGAQAVRKVAAVGAAAGRDRARGGHPGRRVQRRAGPRQRSRRRAGAAHGRRLHRLHRLDRGRQEDHADGRPVEPEARLD